MSKFTNDFGDFFNATLDFSHAAAGTLSHGIYTPGESTVVSVTGCLQPTSKELVMREYGYVTDASYRFFVDGGTGVYISDTTTIDDAVYKVVQRIDWQEYIILLLEVAQNEQK